MKRNKGITLIVLIITIIVMLILLTVSAKVVIDTDILDMAQEAGEDYNQSQELEKDLNANKITMNNTALDKYVQKVCSHTFGADNKCKICGISQITFIVRCGLDESDDVEFTALEGMTWAEFAKSEYCDNNWFLGYLGEDGPKAYCDIKYYLDYMKFDTPIFTGNFPGCADVLVNIHYLNADGSSGDNVLFGDTIVSGLSYRYD